MEYLHEYPNGLSPQYARVKIFTDTEITTVLRSLHFLEIVKDHLQ